MGEAIQHSAGFEPINLPPGHFALDADLDDRLRRDGAAPPREGDIAHPIFAFVGGIGGLGVPVGDAIALAGCSIGAGPLLASCDISIYRALKVGVTYQIAGRIAGKTRKPSRRFGAADHLLLSVSIAEGDVRFVDLDLKMIVPVTGS
ncbi:MAG: hypothetical protein JWP15_3369 [Alphaproteobacteria bacterium]|nr:hypothetical protein [Alphaproteobacteria bacterium]